MKRILAIFLCVLCLTGCSKSDTQDPLAAVRMPMTVTAHISSEAGNGRVQMVFTDATHYTVTYTEPAIMRGVIYERDGDDAYMCFGKSRIPVKDGQICLVSLSGAKLFVPDGATLTASTEDTLDGYRVTVHSFHSDTLSCSHYLAADGMPVRIEGSSDGYSVTFTEIQITYEDI